MLEIKGVKKSYGEFQLDCSLNVEKGRITGLVGENGAGKSTLFKAVLGLISYDAGEIKILGKIPEELSEKEKEELGVVLAEAGFSGYLKGKDVEAVLAKLYPKFEAEKFHQIPPTSLRLWRQSPKSCLSCRQSARTAADIDYELRVDYRKYLKSTYSDSAVRSYLRGMDKAKLYAIRKHANTLKGKQEIAKNTDLIHELLFLPYHPNPAIAERYDCKVAINKLVWDFRVNGSELCKRQLLEIIEDVVLRDIMLRECTMRLNGLKVVYQFCMQEHIEDLRYITQVQADKLEKYADTAYAKELAERELRECQKYLFCHAKNILWDSTVWYLERLHLEQYRVNPSNPVKKFSFMGIEKRENREILQEYMKYCLGVTHLAMSGIQAEFYRILAFVMWMEKETAMELKLASETEIKKYFQIIELKEASYFNDIVIAIYQLYEYLQTKEIIDRIPFRYEYYLKKEIHCHNNRSVEMEIYERILRELKNFPEIPRLILLHSMLIGLRISEVCTLKGDAYSWQGRDAWIQVYQMKMRTYKRVPIPDVLYKIMKRYLEKYHIGSEDYVFQNKRGGAYQYGSFKWQMKELFNKRQDIFKGYDFKSHDFRHTIATLLYDDEVPLQSIRDYLGHDYEEMTQQYVDFMPKKISAANQEFFKKGENSLASGIKKCKRGK